LPQITYRVAMTLTVPGYEVGELLGYGSHGEVWSGRVAGSGQPVALKRIAVQSNLTARSARSEAALLSALSHPNLIGLHEFVAIDFAVVLVLELAAGGSLADLLRRRDRLTPPEVAATLSPIAAALAHAHDEGVLHGDLSAANVLFTGAGQPKLTDLGVARLLGSEGQPIGTPAYVDPVVAAGGAAGAASDVFSLAAVALHALTGSGPWQPPGGTASVDEILAIAAQGVTGDLPVRLSGCPAEMSAVLIRALDAEPHRRGSAAEFALDLRASAQPSAVVLSAGRLPSPVVGRHSADRPGLGSDSWGRQADLTHVARSQIRPTVGVTATSTRRDKVAGLVRRRWVRAVMLGALLTGAAAALLSAGVFPSEHADSATAVHSTSASNSTPPARPLVTDAAHVLDALDGQRAAAFAQRQPELLKHVYLSGALLAQDVAQLQARVPAGCQLSGLRTRYQGISVISQTANRIELRATAELAPAQLRCNGTLRSTTAAAGPTRVRLVLTRSAGGVFGIASQQIGAG
jgi:serine/threonine protein kinase